jgi:diguanylate cyclase (GGDEF)-like protein
LRITGAATIQITTHRDVLRRTARRVAVAVGLTIVMTAAITLVHLGTNPAAVVRVDDVTILSICAATSISAVISGIMTYRSALLMQELTLTRSELSRISQTDQLTELSNRRGFDDAATAALRSTYHASLPSVIFMCDIDHFKSINDRFGHEFGDKALIEIADVLRQFSRAHGALVARHGGEEFAALMNGISREQAEHHAEDIRRPCAARQITSGGIPERVTISIDFTVSRGESELAKIMRIADQALYTAKRRGRDRVERADEAFARRCVAIAAAAARMPAYAFGDHGEPPPAGRPYGCRTRRRIPVSPFFPDRCARIVGERPLVYLKPVGGISTNMLGEPPMTPDRRRGSLTCAGETQGSG